MDIVLEAGADDLVDEGEYFEIITSSYKSYSNVLESLKQ